jgi:hypothetical protein
MRWVCRQKAHAHKAANKKKKKTLHVRFRDAASGILINHLAHGVHLFLVRTNALLTSQLVLERCNLGLHGVDAVGRDAFLLLKVLELGVARAPLQPQRVNAERKALQLE